MDKNCGSCTYLDLNYGGDCNGKYYCNKKWERHLATDIACSNYTKAYSRSSSSYNNAIDYSKSKQQSNCYITTLLCDILKLSDTNYYINILRNFRNNYLRYNIEYNHLLVEYDIVGPIICRNLIFDKQKNIIAAKLFYNYISPVVSLIEDNMFVDAIVRYSMMVSKLKEIYGINTKVTRKDIEECDITLSGHGKYQKKYKY